MKDFGFSLGIVLLSILGLVAGGAAQTAGTVPTSDVLGVHDLSSGNSPMRGPNANACIYCHIPHGGLSTTPLWNQTLSTKQYTLYPAATGATGTPTSLSSSSILCLSCHDGSVAVGQTVGLGTLQVKGTMAANMGTALAGSHPFSMQPQIKDAPTLVSSLASAHTTKDATVKLVNNNIECSTCHDVHNQFRDPRDTRFLVRDNTSGSLCFACHTTGARTVNGADNSLTAWPASVHATSTAVVSAKAGLGGYSNIGEFACGSCHSSHDAVGLGLLRKNRNRPINVDDTSQTCVACHDGSDNLAAPILNVLGDFNTPGQIAHPFADNAGNAHTVGEPVVLDRNRHTTCADCHASHTSQPTAVFAATPNLRPSQTGVSGVAADGTVLKAATYQYENCLRCHGASAQKQSLPAYGYMPARAQFAGDTLDVSLQFARGALSAHPVMRDAINAARPSVLKFMWNINFQVQARAMGGRILCTDCHNSDRNREFGSTGPNGPHGSKYEHILERQYTISRVSPGAAPGSSIVNITPTPVLDPVATAPYALCAKCHDLQYINSGATWTEHTRHIQDGFSCSVCHSAHGVPAGTIGVGAGQGLVSFDMNVVGSNNGLPVSYNNASSCTLTCHGHAHK